tara:strand:+ start:919 stop:2616 length:1698 start_codon:yes stop_codon:yes gene_type:complete
MSLIDVAEELEYVPEQELINLSQNPNSRYPQFLVLSEVQRRNQMRKMYENQVAKQNQPMTTVADEKVMELAASSVMPNVPSPISNEMDQSPKGLLGMASGRSTSKDEARQGIIDLMSDINIKRGEEGLSGFMDAAGDVASVGAAVIPINALGKINMLEKAMRPLKNSFMKALRANEKGNVEYAKLDPLVKAQAKKYIELKKEQDKAYVLDGGLGLGGAVAVPFLNAAQKGFDLEEIKSRDKKANGGLVSLQQGRSTDVAGNIARSLSPQEELEQYGKVLTPEERLRVDAYEKELQERKDNTRLFGGIRDAIREQEDELAIRRLESQERMEEGRARSRLPKVLRDDLNTDSVTADDLQAQMEQQLLRDATATGTQNNVGLVEGANISDSAITPEVKPKTSVIEQIFDTSQQLGLPRIEIPRMTEEEKQRELGAYTLGTLAKAFGTTKNLGEAGAILGEGAMGLSAIKRKQREDDIKVLSADRTQSVEDITLANTLLKTQLLQEQYAKQGDSNRVKSLEILQEEIKRLQDSIPDEETQKRIEKLSAQLDAELSKMFGAEALPMFQGM